MNWDRREPSVSCNSPIPAEATTAAIAIDGSTGRDPDDALERLKASQASEAMRV